MSSVIARRSRASRTTLEEFLALDDDARRNFELIDGMLVERGAVSGRHGRTQSRVSSQLAPYDRRPGGPDRPGGWIFATGVDIQFDAENVVRPDVAGWRRERLADLGEEFPIRVLPDWPARSSPPTSAMT